LQQGLPHAFLLKVSSAFFVTVNPDAVNEIKVFACREGMLNRNILNHAADIALVIQRELHAQALVLRMVVPNFFVVACLFRFFVPIFEADKIERLMLIGEIDDLHGLASIVLRKNYHNREDLLAADYFYFSQIALRGPLNTRNTLKSFSRFSCASWVEF
jgi:hypothetical protein